MLFKAFRLSGIAAALMAVAYLLGPKPAPPVLEASIPVVSADLAMLADSIRRTEAALPLKPDNEARIIWADTVRQTEYALVYLPGFTATYVEGDPIHREFAHRYGYNLYLPRLRGHGLEGEELMLDYHPDSALASAAHALAVGQRIGRKVILMSTSTGGTLSLLLAARHPEAVDGIIAFSPNMAIYNSSAGMLARPWGLQIVRLMMGGNYREYDERPEFKKYWYTRYRLEGLVQLQNLLAHSMNPETYRAVRQPFFMGYYYKNEEEQDKVVSVPAMLDMYRQLSTPDSLKRKVAFQNVGRHALASRLTSSGLDSVRRATFAFAEEVLKLKPVPVRQ